jgi:hypothetical protein
MNVDNQTILEIKAGQIPPDDLLKHLLDKVKPNVVGFAIQDIENGKAQLAIERRAANKLDFTFEDFRALCENAKDYPLTVYLGSLNQMYDPLDIQPFTIHDADGAAMMAIFLEGMVTGNDEPKTHTEQYNLVNGIIVPKITEWADDFDGDLEKITKKLKSDTFNKDFMVHIGHRAVLTIMPFEGDIIYHGKNDLSYTADWGSVSIGLGYGEKAAEPPKAEAPKKKGWFSKPASSEPAQPEVKPTVVPPPPPKPDTSPEIVAAKSSGSYPAKKKETASQSPTLAARPPDWVHKNDHIKLWYDIIGEARPEQWRKKLPIIVKDFEAAKIDNLDEFLAYAMNKKLKTTGGTPNTSAGDPPDETGKADVAAVEEHLPIIPAKDLDKVLSYVAKYLDNNSNVVMKPEEMQQLEKQLPNFAGILGLKEEETINWPLAGLIGLGNTDVRALALYAMMWRFIARPYVQKAPTKVETSTTKVGDTTKVESVDKTPAPAAKKFGSWGSKKVA